MSNITVLLVDDHTIVRQGLRALLLSEGDISIVAEANRREAASWPSTIEDCHYGFNHASAAGRSTRQILKAVPSARVVVLSTTATTTCAASLECRRGGLSSQTDGG